MLKKLLVVLTVLSLTVPIVAFSGETIPAEVKTGLESKGFSFYPGSVFCTGSVNMGVRFASNKPTKEIRGWYKEKYPEWSVMDKYGSWVLYDGPPGANMPEAMSGNMIMVQQNDQLPSWHSLPSEMTTEILATFPQ
jgi:hypothetical protein